MTNQRVAVIGGDGIGPEVVAQALAALGALELGIDTEHFSLGADRFKADGTVLDDDTLQRIAQFDAIFLGAVGAAGPDQQVPPGLIERGMLLKLRFEFDHYINLRPFQHGDIDFVFVREGTEGSYAGEGGFLRQGSAHEIATQGSVNTRHGVERCVRYAFELAAQRQRRHLSLVHKTNVLTYAGSLWQRCFDEVAKEFPTVATQYLHVDAACIHLVERPQSFDVIVTDNLFGDILTDLAGAVTGGIGRAASANLNPERKFPSMFEPVHGSAPDIAGRNIANPLAAITSMAMLVDFLGHQKAAARLHEALRTVATDPQLSTGTTDEVGNRVIERL